MEREHIFKAALSSGNLDKNNRNGEAESVDPVISQNHN
jgi:hypothetical protein